MITKTIKFTDYDGVEREEKFMFNLTKAEVMEMEMSTEGGFKNMIERVIESKDAPTIISIFKNLILKAYGEKSADGRRFAKIGPDGQPLSDLFAQTEAYSVLFMELATNADEAAKFVAGIMPVDMEEAMKDPKIIDMKSRLAPGQDDNK